MEREKEKEPTLEERVSRKRRNVHPPNWFLVESERFYPARFINHSRKRKIEPSPQKKKRPTQRRRQSAPSSLKTQEPRLTKPRITHTKTSKRQSLSSLRTRKTTPKSVSSSSNTLDIEYEEELKTFRVPARYTFRQLLDDAARTWSLNRMDIELQDQDGYLMPMSGQIWPLLGSLSSSSTSFLPLLLISRSSSSPPREEASTTLPDDSIEEASSALPDDSIPEEEFESEPLEGSTLLISPPEQEPEKEEKEKRITENIHKVFGLYTLHDGGVEILQDTTALIVSGVRIVRLSQRYGYTDSSQLFSCHLTPRSDDAATVSSPTSLTGYFARWEPVRLPWACEIQSIQQYETTGENAFILYFTGEMFQWKKNLFESSSNIPASGTVPIQRILLNPKDESLKIAAISSGTSFVVAISRRGEVYSWGTGESGELGLGEVREAEKPERIPIEREMGENERVVAVSCGDCHTLILSSHGRIGVWGMGSDGRLGTGRKKDEKRPVWLEVEERREEEEEEEEIPKRVRFIRIYTGRFHSAALSESGKLYTWGCGKYGQLGHGSQRNEYAPRMVESLKDVAVAQVACEMLYTAVVTVDGDVYTFGFRMIPTEEPSQTRYRKEILCATPRLALEGRKIVQISSCSESGLLLALAGTISGSTRELSILVSSQ